MKLRLKLSHIRKFSLGLLLLLIGGGIGYFIGTRDVNLALNDGPRMSVVNRTTPAAYEHLDFNFFWDVWDQVHKSYLDPNDINDAELVYGAIRGMTAAIGDPYTIFLAPEQNQQVKDDLNGEFEGVGIQLGYIDGNLAVMSPLEGMPAIRQGVRAGDYILNIKDDREGIDEDTLGMSLQEAVTLIRGPRGTSVTLTLYREGRGDFEVTITRDTIVVPSVELKIGDWQDDKFVESPSGPVAWLRVYRFGENTGNQWNQAVSQILSNKTNLRGLVLDLRNNGGGYFDSSIDLASEFIKDGVIVQQQGRYQTETYSVKRQGRLTDIVPVILINKGSASASEILAGALRDRLDSTLVGETSFGKGTVQDALELKHNAGLHVTIARWLLPGGDWIHDTGINPDITVELPEPEEEGQEVVDTQLQRAIEEL